MKIARWLRIAAIALLATATVVISMVGWSYRRHRAYSQAIYTRLVKDRDISDSARKAISALQDAESQQRGYALTGETVYSEAYAADVREWKDEFGTLEIVAEHDPATPLVRDLSEAATRVLNDLAAVAMLVDAGARDAALDRFRKGTSIVYLQQARTIVVKIQQLDGLSADESEQSLIRTDLVFERRFALAAAALFCLALTLALLILVRARNDSEPIPVVRVTPVPYARTKTGE